MAETFDALKKGNLLCIGVFENDRLILILPLLVVGIKKTKKKLRGLQTLSNPAGNQSMRDILVDDEWRETPLLGELIRFLARTDASWDVLSLRGILWDSCAYTMLQHSRGLKLTKTPGGHWGKIYFKSCGKNHDPFARVSKSFRQNLRTSHNKIGPADLKFEQTNNPEELPTFFEVFLKIEASGWKGAEGTSVQYLPAQRYFFESLIRHPSPTGGCEIHLMKVKDEPVAARFCIIENNILYLAAIGYLESMHLLSPGHLALEHLLKTRGVRGNIEMVTPGAAPWSKAWRPDITLGISNVFLRRLENTGGEKSGQLAFSMGQGTGPLIDESTFKAGVPSASMQPFPVRIDPRLDTIGILDIGWVESREQFFTSAPGIRAIRVRGFVPFEEGFKDQRYVISYPGKRGSEKPLAGGDFKLTIPWDPQSPEATLEFTVERRRTENDDRSVSCQLKSVELLGGTGFFPALKERLRSIEMGFRQARKCLKLKLALFLQTYLFDLRYGTDTHVVIPKEEYAERPSAFDRGTPYHASWTFEIKKSFALVRDKLGSDLSSYTFVDLGCGKGKAVLVWKLLLARHGVRQDMIGIDYSESLIQVARANYRKIFREEGPFVVADAVTFNYAALSDKIMIYMFNPFDEIILQRVLDSLKGLKTVLIYFNADHEALVARNGWTEVHRRKGFWGFNRSIIYVRNID